MEIIDGKKVSAACREEIKQELTSLGKKVGLAVLLVGNDKASEIYVRNKENACKEVGIQSYPFIFDENADEQSIIQTIIACNQNPDIYGILVQLPLPERLDAAKILSYIDPKKDVDGFSRYQMGKLLLGEDCLVSCTPQGILQLLDAYHIPVAG